jgi:hypothetical protein
VANTQSGRLEEKVLSGPVILPSEHATENWSYSVDPNADDVYHAFAHAVHFPQSRLPADYLRALRRMERRSHLGSTFAATEVAHTLGRVHLTYRDPQEVYAKIAKYAEQKETEKTIN